MSDNKRIGRQFPTQSVVLEYNDTKGGEAILLYEQSTRRLMPWQQEQLYNIMAIDEDGYWKHIKYGWSIPRRNGKSEVAIAESSGDFCTTKLCCIRLTLSIPRRAHS